jgi:DNA-binding XRE family transcriptional regulator
VDKRYKALEPAEEGDLAAEIFTAVLSGSLSLSQSIKELRRLSRLTQPEFAKHRGVSLDSLRALETGKGNPTVETINKVASIFGLEVGLVSKKRGQMNQVNDHD